MPYSRANKIKSEKYNNNITRRGLVGAEIAKKKEEKEAPPAISPYLVIGFLALLVLSTFFQIYQMASRGPIF